MRPGLGGQDQQVEDPHLGEPVTAPGGLLPNRSHRHPVVVRVARVQPRTSPTERALCERSVGLRGLEQVRRDDASGHEDQRRALWGQRPGHLREAGPLDAANIAESCLSGSHGT
jgi:hypothetical protein